MTKNQACEPCVKRKVRCDRGIPCSNCKRRKTDHCAYTAVSPQDRIKQLEALVDELKSERTQTNDELEREAPPAAPPAQQVDGPTDQEGSLLLDFLQSQFRGEQVSTSTFGRGDGVSVLEEGDKSCHDEAGGVHDSTVTSSKNTNRRIASKTQFPVQERPHTLQGMCTGLRSESLNQRFPLGDHAKALWDIFMDRVEPHVKICYSWWLDTFRSRAVEFETVEKFSNAEGALLSSIYLISVVSMTDNMCLDLWQQPRNEMIQRYQSLCDESLLRINLLCMSDALVIKAVVFYATSGYDRFSTQSLSSLVGLAIRNAERLGMHQDGAATGLSPCQTEEYRRLWWQLQHLDMGMAIRNGSPSITLMADWNCKIPLNIEDNDITPTTTKTPPNRIGLTSVSAHRFVCFLVNEHRKIHRRSSTSPSSSSPHSAHTLDRFESTLNQEFVQYCDPINPTQIFIQICARFMIAGMRLWSLYQNARKDPHISTKEWHRTAILELATKCLHYNNTAHTYPELTRYRWLTKEWTPYHALICVLTQIPHQASTKNQEIWTLLSKTYELDKSLWDLAGDRRKFRVAEAVVAAWNARTRAQNGDKGTGVATTGQMDAEFTFARELERELMKLKHGIPGVMTASGSEQQQQQQQQQQQHQQQQEMQPPDTSNVSMVPESLDAHTNSVFDLDFQDLDWEFWCGAGD